MTTAGGKLGFGGNSGFRGGGGGGGGGGRVGLWKRDFGAVCGHGGNLGFGFMGGS